MGSSKESNSRSIFTKNEAIIEIAINHIVLDITLAGQRLNFDSNPIVKKDNENADLQLNKLLKNKKTFNLLGNWFKIPICIVTQNELLKIFL